MTYAQNDENILDINNSTVNNSTINNFTIDNSTINNSTINNSTINNFTINNSTINNSTDDTNLLFNANFTHGSTLTNSRVMENDVSGNVKCVTTQNMQSICYRGQSEDDGTKKMKIYQAPVTESHRGIQLVLLRACKWKYNQLTDYNRRRGIK